MKNRTKARRYTAPKLQELFDEITPLEMEQKKVKMQLAARLEDCMRAKGWSKSQFAKKAKKNPSEITKWFSGTQNFTIDVLIEIAYTLGVELTKLFDQPQTQIIYSKEIVSKSPVAQPTIVVTTPMSEKIDVYGLSLLTRQGNNILYTNYNKV